MFYAAAEGQEVPEDPQYRKTTIKAASKTTGNNNKLYKIQENVKEVKKEVEFAELDELVTKLAGSEGLESSQNDIELQGSLGKLLGHLSNRNDYRYFKSDLARKNGSSAR
jgi:glutamate synthase domain-containing protein 3